ncbi:hypothetical protein L4D15_00260 [Enterovibrio norvegicus]|uniref:hypothetical protein n=1 Tax=Enterovibrio norvegicus TaxID=188144 RepID=UPI003D0B02EC
MRKIIAFLILVLFCSSLSAASSYYRSRTIVGAGIYFDGAKSILIIDINGAKPGLPSCATTNRLAISSTAPHYKEIVSIVMTAYTSNQNNVDIFVTDTCEHWGNSQDILGVKMGSIAW